jgi:hypothetical protein
VFLLLDIFWHSIKSFSLPGFSQIKYRKVLNLQTEGRKIADANSNCNLHSQPLKLQRLKGCLNQLLSMYFSAKVTRSASKPLQLKARKRW